MVRTQIYLDEAQKAELERMSSERKATVSELIRQAIDQFVGRSSTSLEDALDQSFGLWRDREDIGDASKYVRRIRKEWEKRNSPPREASSCIP